MSLSQIYELAKIARVGLAEIYKDIEAMYNANVAEDEIYDKLKEYYGEQRKEG